VTDPIVLDVSPLQARWQTLDPFLFCVHHDDAYPRGNDEMGPAASLSGRDIGQDFSARDGWSMYHGDRVPGFPQHPHRGFETVTIARHGFIDHSDSLGASARFGDGDLQWMTAGRGIVHSEMFPLVHRDRENRTELFQIWLNLPSGAKMAEPYFSMFWNDGIPTRTSMDEAGRETSVVSYAGALADGRAPPAPPPDSWAAEADNRVVIWTIKMAPEATWTLPAAGSGLNRRLFYFRGGEVTVAGGDVAVGNAITLTSSADIDLVNQSEETEFLLLQGRPIGEPVAQYGPFVMNNRDELQQAFEDYQRTAFGGWPWPNHDPTHPRENTRFARYPDGRTIAPTNR
jgi:quercetin 2,3-dioxygenase